MSKVSLLLAALFQQWSLSLLSLLRSELKLLIMDVLLSSAGWYRGFILKNPNVKVGKHHLGVYARFEVRTLANAVSTRGLGPSVICLSTLSVIFPFVLTS